MTPAAHPVGDPRHVPDAWPRLLSKPQLCAYVGVCWATLSRVLTVSPRDLGANVLRYDRLEVDAWVSSLPARAGARLPSAADDAQSASDPSSTADDPARDMTPARDAALERARARAAGGRRKWRTPN